MKVLGLFNFDRPCPTSSLNRYFTLYPTSPHFSSSAAVLLIVDVSCDVDVLGVAEARVVSVWVLCLSLGLSCPQVEVSLSQTGLKGLCPMSVMLLLQGDNREGDLTKAG